MSKYHFETLSVTDYSFLVQESPTLHMTVIGMTVFNAGPLQLRDGGVDFQAIKGMLGDVLHLVPRYRQKLMWRTIEQTSGYLSRETMTIKDLSHPPVWVDDEHFNLDYHVRHTALPRPGNKEQLLALVGRIASQPLDMSKPLWETWIAEGLEGGRYAMISKLHHCMIDGKSGAEVSQLILSPDPDYEAPAAPPYEPRPAPSQKQLRKEMRKEKFSAPFKMAENLRKLREESDDLGEEIARRVKGIRETFAEGGGKRSETPVNGDNSPHRVADFHDTSLAYIKKIRKKWDCSINDIVLTIVCDTFRTYLQQTDFDIDNEPFRITVPVSIWSERKKGEIGNQIMSWLITLPLSESDPKDQLQAIKAITQDLKKSDKALGVKTLESFLRYTPGLVALGARNANGPINSFVTNVPGPQMALYQNGAEMLDNYPVVPLLENVGVAVGVMSYNGKLNWGVTADPGIVSDIDVFMAALEQSIKTVGKSAGVRYTRAG